MKFSTSVWGRFDSLKTMEVSCVTDFLDFGLIHVFPWSDMLKTFKAEVGSVVLDTSFLFEVWRRL